MGSRKISPVEWQVASKDLTCRKSPSPGMSRQDEKYVLDLCDKVLGLNCLRQHTFDFLRGDRGHLLPVDGYYSELDLVIEYQERQHISSVPFFDRKLTLSGISRGAQRALYDERRRELLPKHGIQLVEFTVTEFAHNSKLRLRREEANDILIVRRKLDQFIKK